ncbi:hypothetical protein DM785_02795 [Deinococcus actinosclerus]|nr:hypothetical protein DM785_02795 [Deinococcus actinosclerus]
MGRVRAPLSVDGIEPQDAHTLVMTDALQQVLHHAATHSPATGRTVVFLAADLIAVLAAGFLTVLALRRHHLTRALLLRMVLSGVIAILLTLFLGHAVHDPRPFIAEHYVPLTHASTDNGFPSDHVLMAALITGWVAWLSRAWPAFALGTLAIAAGRLGIGAHHTLDVLGSLVIAGLSLTAARLIPLPDRWRSPLLNGTSPRTSP